MMKMYCPPHPGEIIKGLWLDPMGVSITDAAQAMDVSRKTLSKIVNGNGRVTPEIALRLSIALGSSAESGPSIVSSPASPSQSTCSSIRRSSHGQLAAGTNRLWPPTEISRYCPAI